MCVWMRCMPHGFLFFLATQSAWHACIASLRKGLRRVCVCVLVAGCVNKAAPSQHRGSVISGCLLLSSGRRTVVIDSFSTSVFICCLVLTPLQELYFSVLASYNNPVVDLCLCIAGRTAPQGMCGSTTCAVKGPPWWHCLLLGAAAAIRDEPPPPQPSSEDSRSGESVLISCWASEPV